MCFHQRAVNKKQTTTYSLNTSSKYVDGNKNFIFLLTCMIGSEMISAENDYLMAPGLLFSILILSLRA